MTAPRRLQLRRGNTTAVSSYTGAAGELVVNTTDWTLRVHDGVTVGGYAATVNTASINSNISAITNGTAVFGNLIPSANVAYTLGNITHQWRDLFVSNSTIYVGGVPLTIDAAGNLTVNGNVIPSIGYVNTVVANVTVDLSSYALNANVTAANLGMKGYVDQANTIQSAQISAANVGMKGYVDSQSFYSNTKVADYLPTYSGDIAANISKAGYIWTFGTDGNLVLPLSGYLGNVWGEPSETTLAASPGGFVAIANSSGDQYVDANDNNVQIGTNYRSGVGNVWLFYQNGWLVFPDNTVQTTAYTGYGNTQVGAYTNLSTYAYAANVTAANVGIKGYVDQANTIQSAQITAANVGMKGYVDSQTYSNINVTAYLAAQTAKTIVGNVTIEGNLTVNGNVSYISVNNLVIGDNIINLADLNPADSLDIGFVGHRTPFGDPLQHTGLVRDASANQWRLFSNVVPAPGTTVDFTDAIYDDLKLGNVFGRLNLPDGSIVSDGVFTAATGSSVNLLSNNEYNQIRVDDANVEIYTSPNGFTQSQWTFGQDGNLTLPSNNSSINYANGVSILSGLGGGSSNYSNVNVKAYTESMGFVNYSNVNVAAYLATATINTTGNITAGNLITSGALYVANITTTGASGNISGANYITANFFIGNGSQLTGLPAGYSNVQVSTYLPTYSGNIANIRLGVSGVLTFPDGTTQSTAGGGGGSNYGNGNVASYLITNGYINTNSAYSNSNVTAYTVSMGFTNFSNVNVAAYTTTQGFTNYSNVNVAAYLPSHTGNVGVNTLLGTTPNVVLTAGSYSSTFDTLGNVVLPSAYVTGNVVGQYILGNGAFLTGVVTGSSYSNVQVATYLPTYTGVVTASNVAVNGNVTAQYLFGNGSQLTGLPATYSNVQVAAYLNATGYNLYSNANVASYLPLYGGDISARDITVSGNIQLTGNILQINAAVFYGNTLTGFEALYAGIPGYTPIPQVIAQFTADFNGYAQINSQNLGTGNQASSDFIATANNGTDSTYFVDVGIAGSGYDPSVAANNNAIGTALYANDAYFYTAGNTAANPGGNLVIGVQTLNKNIKFFAGGVNANNVVLTIQGNGITTAGNVTGTYFIGNGSQLSGLSVYSNVQTKAYAETMGYQNYGNVNVKAYTESMGFANYGDSNVASYLNTYSGNISAGYFIGDGSQLTGLSIPVTYSNVNVKAYTETMGFRNYGNVNVAAYLNASGYNLYSNVNVAAYLSTASITTTGNITAQNISGNISITGNVTGTSANVTLQAGSFSSTFDNQGNVRLPNVYVSGNVVANYFLGNGALLTGIVAGGSSYSNVDVQAYLSGSVTGIVPATAYSNNLGTNVKPWGNFFTYNMELAGGYFKTNGTGGVSGQVLKSTGDVNPPAWSNIADIIAATTGQITIANIKLGSSGNIVFADGTVQTTAGGGSYSNVQVATYLPTYSGNIANIRLGVAGVLTFADGTTQITAGGGSYSNVQVATYLPTHTGSINASNILVTGANITLGNIQATTAATNPATGALRVMGGVGVAGAVVAAQLNSTGNVLANAISAYSLNTIANVTASVVNAGTINSAGNVLAQNLIGTIATANQTGITAVGTLATLSVTGNATVGNLIGTEANTRIIANIHTTTFDIYGNVSFPGNVSVAGLGVTMPARPAFRVNGVNPGGQSTANTNLKGSAISTVYNQGNYFNATTGIFTAPVGGIYEVLLNARVNGSHSGAAQLVVLKNGLNSGGNIAAFWETSSNIGGATHFGVSGTVVLAAGEYLSANILLGNITFDQNDNWCVTYLG